jgi:transcriptional regulator with XRE-family HTH domain
MYPGSKRAPLVSGIGPDVSDVVCMDGYRSPGAPGNRLGEFLRARREVIDPDGRGVVHSGRRRTPGLRREEVAILAGVSTDYYIRLEQGRECRPSEQVLDALAEALELDPAAVEYLYHLAHPPSRRREGFECVERVSRNLMRLMRVLSTPAVVLGCRMDVLASNAPAAFLYRGLEHSDNLVRLTFLNPAASEFYRDWEYVAHSKAALLRSPAVNPEDPYVLELVREVAERSAEFRRLWARHDVRAVPPARVELHHRDVGDLTLTYESLTVNSAPTQRLIVYQAAPGAASECALERLIHLAAEIGGERGGGIGEERPPHGAGPAAPPLGRPQGPSLGRR